MPTGHFKRSRAHCKAISRALKGRKKRPMSAETKAKISSSLCGRRFSELHREKLRKAMLGKKRAPFSVEWKRKLADHLRKYSKQKRTKEWRLRLSKARKASGVAKGKNNPNWKGGLTSDQSKLRASDEYKEWRRSVYERDGYKCRRCGVRGNGKNLQAHHKEPVCVLLRTGRRNEVFRVGNGMTLCNRCHCRTKTYGWKSWNLLKKMDKKT